MDAVTAWSSPLEEAALGASPTVAAVPLVVALDGALLATNSTLESWFLLLRHHPLRALGSLGWLARGRALFKARLAAIVMPEVTSLPFRKEVLDLLRSMRDAGRPRVLATAANRQLAQAIATHVGLFDEVIASDDAVNCAGEVKRQRLLARYGERGFDYLGHGLEDLPVYASARSVSLVAPSKRVLARVEPRAVLDCIIAAPRATAGDYLHLLRVHHWIKNLLVFLPLLGRHQGFDREVFARGALIFLAFSLCASGLYLANDLMDLPADRINPLKWTRRFASGRIHPAKGLILSPLLLLGGLLLGGSLSRPCVGILAAYTLLMVLYSVRLKDVPILDAGVLASGYVLRAAAGSSAMQVPISGLLLIACGLLFFSLVLVKRFAALEYVVRHEEVQASRAPTGNLPGYRLSDRRVLQAESLVSGYFALVLLLVGLDGGRVLSGAAPHPEEWLLGALLFLWLSYLWLRATRGDIRVDPVVFALRDRRSIALLIGMGGAALVGM